MSLPTEQHFILKENGLIYWIEHPAERCHECDNVVKVYDLCEQCVIDYDNAKKAAIDSAIEVSNQEKVYDVIRERYLNEQYLKKIIPPLDVSLERGKVYSLLCSVEIKEAMYMTNPPRTTGYKRATVIFPEQGTREKGMDELTIYRYQAKTIENALRLAMNVLESRNKAKETAMDRELLRADNFIKEVLTRKK